MNIIGISAFYHDSAACLLQDGKITAAAQEERFTRKRHDPNFPAEALKYCLKQASLELSQIDAIVFYDKPIISFERLLETYISYAPKGLKSFLKSMPVWLKEKLFLKKLIKDELAKIFNLKANSLPEVYFNEHHQSHAASCFFPSPFQEAAVLCLDGVGEWATTSAWLGKDNSLEALWEIKFPHSLGLLYSAITYYTGFKVNSGEYKVMGLAPYGEPKYVQTIYNHLIDVKSDGSFRLNMEYFDYCVGLKMVNKKFEHIFGGPARQAESLLTQKEMDLAKSVQVVTEEIVSKLAKSLHQETGLNNLCMAGGVALNCVANGKLLKDGPFKDIWIQPAAGDAGGCIGAAYSLWHQMMAKPRKATLPDAMSGAYLGPSFSNGEINTFLEKNKIPAKFYENEDTLYDQVAEDLAQEKVVGWFQGRMEFGPRALGARSIIGDPRSKKMQSIMNLKIKYRESFRPFAPSILRERVQDYFDIDYDSPYMLLVADVLEKRRISLSTEDKKKWGIDLLNIPKSDLPAITHVDYSARLQTVHKETNPSYYKLISKFEEKTGCPVVVNTSFNVRGEPIVCTPEDAYRCFMRTEIDTLVLQNYVLRKSEQPKISDNASWKTEFELD